MSLKYTEEKKITKKGGEGGSIKLGVTVVAVGMLEGAYSPKLSVSVRASKHKLSFEVTFCRKLNLKRTTQTE